MADIELVIKLDEDIAQGIIDGKNDAPRNIVRNFQATIAYAIKNGIPLPKGHGDLKDQKDLAKSLYDYQWIDQPTYIEVTNRLINAPTIIEKDKEQTV